jgi:hypothetical protein
MRFFRTSNDYNNEFLKNRAKRLFNSLVGCIAASEHRPAAACRRPFSRRLCVETLEDRIMLPDNLNLSRAVAAEVVGPVLASENYGKNEPLNRGTSRAALTAACGSPNPIAARSGR